MDGIFCGECGTRLNEAPILPPDQQPPCPRCSSLARRFGQEITDQVAVSDSGSVATIAHAESAMVTVTAHDATVSVQAHAEVAEGVGQAFDATVRTEPGEARSGAAMGQARVEGQSSGIRGPRRIITDPTVYRRQRWTPLPGPAGRWLVEAIGDDGELLDMGMGDNEDDILLGIIDSLRPPTTD